MAEVRAEITANVWQVRVEVGQEVVEGDELVVLESMKMEIPVAGARRRQGHRDQGRARHAGARGRRHRRHHVIRASARRGVTLLTIDRPERRNAVDTATVTELADHLDAAVAAGGRVVVLTGAGGNFCAGADLGGVEDEDFAAALGRVLDALRHPGIVSHRRRRRAALGAGTQLAVVVRPPRRHAGGPLRDPGGAARPRRRPRDDPPSRRLRR